MGFLKNFLKSGGSDSGGHATADSFRSLSDEQFEAHVGISRYGDFQLTDAVRPAWGLDIVPRTGYRHEWFVDPDSGARLPVLMVSVSRERLFDLFITLLEPLGDVVDVILETSHQKTDGGHTDLFREQIDMPVLQSILYEFEDVILHDGCCGIAVMNPKRGMEIQFDEHKLLFLYGKKTSHSEAILQSAHVPLVEDLQFINEAEHVHISSNDLQQRFDQLCWRLGIERPFEE
ncbi:MAG: hypothetical protein RL215_2052 [Planctomycetota bacterium]